MRIAVLSSTTFGWKCLSEGILPAADVEVAGVLTTPEEIRISWSQEPVRISTWFDFAAEDTGLDVVTLDGPVTSESYLVALQRWDVDLILALGWYYLIPKSVRNAAPAGCLGIHASLLPKYRGGAPLVWAMIEGETRTGVSLFHLEDEVDAGDIVAQHAIDIRTDDTIGTLYSRVESVSCSLLRETLPDLANCRAKRCPQNHAEATHFPQRQPEDGEIDWSWDADRIRNFIRAQTRPYPGAFFYAGGKKVTVWDASVVDVDGGDLA